jgi:hypothetical protein
LEGKLLNLRGRRELVKTILGSLPTYLVTAIKPIKKFFKDMDKFFKVSWAQVCRPIDRGGLGITDLERFGRSVRIHWLWYQWKHPKKPWCNSELPLDKIDETLFALATRVHVYNGKTARFWTSSWLNGVSPAAMFPTLYKHSKRKNRTVLDAMTDDNWIRDLMHNLTAQLITEYVLLWELVDAAVFQPHRTERR